MAFSIYLFAFLFIFHVFYCWPISLIIFFILNFLLLWSPLVHLKMLYKCYLNKASFIYSSIFKVLVFMDFNVKCCANWKRFNEKSIKFGIFLIFYFGITNKNSNMNIVPHCDTPNAALSDHSNYFVDIVKWHTYNVTYVV